MYNVRQLLLAGLIFSSGISLSSISYADSVVTMQQSSNITTSASNYDEFDSLAEDMVDSGIPIEEPKQLSCVDRWIQALCSPIIMRYVAVKGYMRQWCYWMIGVVRGSSNPQA